MWCRGGKKELKSATGIWTSDVPIVLPNSWPPFHLEQLGASCNLLIAQDICSLLSCSISSVSDEVFIIQSNGYK